MSKFEEMGRVFKSKTHSLRERMGKLKLAVVQKRIPPEYDDELLALTRQVDDFLREDAYNMKELLTFYRDVSGGKAKNVDPPLTDSDVKSVYATTLYRMEQYNDHIEEIEKNLLPGNEEKN